MAPAAGSADRTLFEDEFSGPSLDRAKWNVIVTGSSWRTVNNEQQAYVDAPDVLEVRDGLLTIHPRLHPAFATPDGKTADFLSGRIDTRGKFEFVYGTAAARMKLAPGAGLWPAFWALGNGRWPDTGEIDVMENVGEATWTSVALHGPGYFGNTPLVKHATVDISQWHVYSVDWTADLLVFRIDGKEIYRASRADVEKYGRWAYDNPKHLIVNLALGGGYPHGVNHVEQPYFGLPQTTVDAVKAGKADTLVDWVRVTQP
ncbi:MAG TPA: glycoside hydrolase family 16 protein [Vicinamibacterales bacterium]|jgi:beta-glucanase (GH16 family)